ncbi:MAG: hypothetical protein GQ470_00005, partial [Gammaproteobacteria bacterium]|nr:hypothetical protein [Gammaproteobacteria bacterium]
MAHSSDNNKTVIAPQNDTGQSNVINDDVTIIAPGPDSSAALPNIDEDETVIAPQPSVEHSNSIN